MRLAAEIVPVKRSLWLRQCQQQQQQREEEDADGGTAAGPVGTERRCELGV